MPTELRDCAEDSKILEQASDPYAERTNGEKKTRAGSAAKRAESRSRIA